MGGEKMSEQNSMKKIVIHSAGGYDKLKIEQHPLPSLSQGEVLIKTKAIGINYADCCVRWGVYESAKKFVGWPITPGFEFSGIVVESKSNKFKKNDEVFGLTRFDAYATHVKVPEYQLFIKPQKLSFSEAAGFTAAYMTAYHALFHHLILPEKAHILVHSAGGGVGSCLVQLAKVKNHKVYAVVGSSHKVNFVKSLGADHVIDKSSQDLWGEIKKLTPDGLDLILDANGPETFRKGFHHLKPMGKLMVYGSHTLLPKKGGKINYLVTGFKLLKNFYINPIKLISENKGVIGFNLSFLFEHTELFSECIHQLIKWYEEGKILAPKTTEFAFEDVAKAHQMIESGQSTGKLVLVV